MSSSLRPTRVNRSTPRYSSSKLSCPLIVRGVRFKRSLAADYGVWFEAAHQIILVIFILEAALKITAVAPCEGRYFGDGWNLLDF